MVHNMYYIVVIPSVSKKLYGIVNKEGRGKKEQGRTLEGHVVGKAGNRSSYLMWKSLETSVD